VGALADVVTSVFRPALAVSLRGVAASFLRGAAARVSALGGLNRITGVSLERDGDLLLLGHKESRLPALHVDDLVIALRSAFRAGSQYQEPIGCTIDPREGADDPWTMQVARTFGIEPSAMAARHVAIDYEMKQASLGLISLKPGMPTLLDEPDGPSGCAKSAKLAKESTETAFRFWFCPKVAQAPRFVREGGTLWIQKPVGVQVLTEQEFLDSKAHRVGGKPAEGSAVKFAAAMTGLLESGELPQYASLRGDFRLIEAAKLAPLLGVESDAIVYYLNDHVVRKEKVPAYVGGLWREETTEFTCQNKVEEIPDSEGVTYQTRADIRRSRQRVVGGVEASIPIAAKDVRPGHNQLSAVMTRVREARPAADTAIWTIAV
jgi:hypothetical protein